MTADARKSQLHHRYAHHEGYFRIGRSIYHILTVNPTLTLVFIVILYFQLMDFILYFKIRTRGPLNLSGNDIFSSVPTIILLNSTNSTFSSSSYLSSFVQKLTAKYINNSATTSESVEIYNPLSIKKIMVGHIIHYIRAPLAEHVEQTLHFTDHFPYISSNTVSFFHCFLSLISIKFLSNNLLTHRQVGVILFLIRNFLDCLDGVVYRAHLKNKRYKSYYGSFGYYVDALSDIIGGTCLILSCLFYFFKNPPFCTSNITLLSRLPSLSRTTRTVSSTSTSSEANGTDTILVLTNNDPKLDIYPENDDYQTITNIRHSPLSSPTLSLTNHLNNLSSRSSTLLSTTTVVQQTQSQLVPLGLQSVVESKETIFLTVLAFALRYSLSAIFWDRSLRWYEYLLDSPASTVTQQALQLSILHSPLTIVIMFLWRYLCALSIQDYLLFAIFINRTWEFLIKTNQIGWFAIILTIIFTELHINEIQSIFLTVSSSK